MDANIPMKPPPRRKPATPPKPGNLSSTKAPHKVPPPLPKIGPIGSHRVETNTKTADDVKIADDVNSLSDHKLEESTEENGSRHKVIAEIIEESSYSELGDHEMDNDSVNSESSIDQNGTHIECIEEHDYAEIDENIVGINNRDASIKSGSETESKVTGIKTESKTEVKIEVQPRSSSFWYIDDIPLDPPVEINIDNKNTKGDSKDKNMKENSKGKHRRKISPLPEKKIEKLAVVETQGKKGETIPITNEIDKVPLVKERKKDKTPIVPEKKIDIIPPTTETQENKISTPQETEIDKIHVVKENEMQVIPKNITSVNDVQENNISIDTKDKLFPPEDNTHTDVAEKTSPVPQARKSCFDSKLAKFSYIQPSEINLTGLKKRNNTPPPRPPNVNTSVSHPPKTSLPRPPVSPRPKPRPPIRPKPSPKKRQTAMLSTLHGTSENVTNDVKVEPIHSKEQEIDKDSLSEIAKPNVSKEIEQDGITNIETVKKFDVFKDDLEKRLKRVTGYDKNLATENEHDVTNSAVETLNDTENDVDNSVKNTTNATTDTTSSADNVTLNSEEEIPSDKNITDNNIVHETSSLNDTENKTEVKEHQETDEIRTDTHIAIKDLLVDALNKSNASKDDSVIPHTTTTNEDASKYAKTFDWTTTEMPVKPPRPKRMKTLLGLDNVIRDVIHARCHTTSINDANDFTDEINKVANSPTKEDVPLRDDKHKNDDVMKSQKRSFRRSQSDSNLSASLTSQSDDFGVSAEYSEIIADPFDDPNEIKRISISIGAERLSRDMSDITTSGDKMTPSDNPETESDVITSPISSSDQIQSPSDKNKSKKKSILGISFGKKKGKKSPGKRPVGSAPPPPPCIPKDKHSKHKVVDKQDSGADNVEGLKIVEADDDWVVMSITPAGEYNEDKQDAEDKDSKENEHTQYEDKKDEVNNTNENVKASDVQNKIDNVDKNITKDQKNKNKNNKAKNMNHDDTNVSKKDISISPDKIISPDKKQKSHKDTVDKTPEHKISDDKMDVQTPSDLELSFEFQYENLRLKRETSNKSEQQVSEDQISSDKTLDDNNKEHEVEKDGNTNNNSIRDGSDGYFNMTCGKSSASSSVEKLDKYDPVPTYDPFDDPFYDPMDNPSPVEHSDIMEDDVYVTLVYNYNDKVQSPGGNKPQLVRTKSETREVNIPIVDRVMKRSAEIVLEDVYQNAGVKNDSLVDNSEIVSPPPVPTRQAVCCGDVLSQCVPLPEMKSSRKPGCPSCLSRNEIENNDILQPEPCLVNLNSDRYVEPTSVEQDSAISSQDNHTNVTEKCENKSTHADTNIKSSHIYDTPSNAINNATNESKQDNQTAEKSKPDYQEPDDQNSETSPSHVQTDDNDKNLLAPRPPPCVPSRKKKPDSGDGYIYPEPVPDEFAPEHYWIKAGKDAPRPASFHNLNAVYHRDFTTTLTDDPDAGFSRRKAKSLNFVNLSSKLKPLPYYNPKTPMWLNTHAESFSSIVSSAASERSVNTLISSSSDGERSDEEISQMPERTRDKLFYIAEEMMTSERTFLDILKLLNIDLRHAVTQVIEVTGKPAIPTGTLNSILEFLPSLQSFSEDLLSDLTERIQNWTSKGQVAEIFVRKGPFLKLATSYIRNFETASALLDDSRRRYPAFDAACKDFEASPRCANLAIKAHMLKPIQRIPQYKLLLQDYMKKLPPDSEEHQKTLMALATINEVASHANDSMKNTDAMQEMLHIQSSLIGRFEVITPGREFIKKGELLKLSRKELHPRMFFLFNDVLLYTTPMASGYKLRDTFPLAGMKVSKTEKDETGREFSVISFKRSFSLAASGPEEREKWVDALNKAITDNLQRRSTFEGHQPTMNESFVVGEQAPVWIPDARVTMCMLCTCEFSMTWRRHHCRCCGRVVCTDCSGNNAPLKFLNYKVARVCSECYKTLRYELEEKEKISDSVPGTEDGEGISISSLKSRFTKIRRSFGKGVKKRPAVLQEVHANDVGSTCSGYLRQLRGKKWKRYWFVIKNYVLYTYKASEDMAAIESSPLLGYTVTKVEEVYEGIEPGLVFQLVHANTEPLVFRTESLESTERWLTWMEQAVSTD